MIKSQVTQSSSPNTWNETLGYTVFGKSVQMFSKALGGGLVLGSRRTGEGEGEGKHDHARLHVSCSGATGAEDRRRNAGILAMRLHAFMEWLVPLGCGDPIRKRLT